MKKSFKSIENFEKDIFHFKLKIYTLFYFLPKIIIGEIRLSDFIAFLKKMTLISEKMGDNKIIKINNKFKMDIFLPRFPSKSFFQNLENIIKYSRDEYVFSAMISITYACPYNCPHCYQRLDKGNDIELSLLLNTLKQIQDKGIANITFQGGEPFLRYDRLLEAVKVIDNRTEIWINSTGYGITKERLEELKQYNLYAIMFSLHTINEEEFDAFFDKKGAFKNTLNAVELCNDTGIITAFNICLKRGDYFNGKFEKLMDKAKELGGAFVFLVDPKPSGKWLDEELENFSENELIEIKAKIDLYNHNKRFKNYPSIWSQLLKEQKDQFGCVAGGIERFYLNAKGDVQPCEFLNLSFGNVMDEDFNNIFNIMRKYFKIPRNKMPCKTCSNVISKFIKENNIVDLPLGTEDSIKIIKDSNMGTPTLFYQKIDEISKKNIK